MEINRYNKRAFNLIKKGENLFITGEARTGKSTLLRKIVDDLQSKKALAVLAPTGVAAEYVRELKNHENEKSMKERAKKLWYSIVSVPMGGMNKR